MNEHLATRLVVGHKRLAFGRFRLVVLSGPDTGKETLSDGEELSIGSDSGNSLALTDPTVSRQHCTITVTAEGPLLRDLGSTNGTTLGGHRVLTAYVGPGAMLGVGHSLLRFEPLDEESEAPLSQDESWDRALGRSPAMRRIFELLPRIAASNSTVLLEGETGTGKGLIAGALHRNSPRADRPLVVVDCGSIPPTLIESELFGHEKGAFTGANTARAGAFEAAHGGTVFLDEIGELAVDMQPKLLRALEERTVKRLGSVHEIPLQVRVIAATNRDLREEINKGAFRSDLYYRLNTVKIRIPPLRERPEDIPMLVSHFYGQFVGNEKAEPSPELLSTLCRQSWPGNVRELRSAVERAVLLGDLELWNEINAPGAQPSSGAEPRDVFDPALSFRAAKDRAVARWEKWFVDELTRRHTGNLSRAARAARMDRNHLRELLQKHGVGAKDD